MKFLKLFLYIAMSAIVAVILIIAGSILNVCGILEGIIYNSGNFLISLWDTMIYFKVQLLLLAVVIGIICFIINYCQKYYGKDQIYYIAAVESRHYLNLGDAPLEEVGTPRLCRVNNNKRQIEVFVDPVGGDNLEGVQAHLNTLVRCSHISITTSNIVANVSSDYTVIAVLATNRPVQGRFLK